MNYNGLDSLFTNSWINLKNEGKLKTLTESEVLTSSLRACSYGGRGARKGEVTHLPEVRKTWPSHATSRRWDEA